METSLAVAQIDPVQTISGRHDPSTEVGGKDSVVPTRDVVGLRESATSAERAHTQAVRRRRRQDSDDDGRRVSRALSLVRVGELSAARQALEGAPVAPGTMATLRALTDPERRPPLPREGLSRAVAETQPLEQFELNSDEFLVCLRKARRGAAAGPSGMTDV